MLETAERGCGNAHLLDEVQRRADYLSTLNEISMSLASVLERDALFEKIYREVCRIIPVDAFFVAIYHAGKREMEMAFLMDQEFVLLRRGFPWNRALPQR